MQRAVADVVIAISSTTSVATPIRPGFVLAGIITPATLTGDALTFKGAAITDPAAYQNLYNGGTLYSVAMGVDRFIALDTNITQGLAAFQLVSDETELAARTFQAVYIKE